MKYKHNYSYKELEALGELLISLPGICRMKGADDVPSSEIIEELTRLACDFEEEWSKLSFDEHEGLGEDWLTEIDKLADWVKGHLYDVLHNRLEYSGYSAGKTVWSVVSEVVEEGDHPDKVICSDRVVVDVDNEADARARMMDIAFASLHDYVDDEFNDDVTYTLKQNHKGDVEMHKIKLGPMAIYHLVAQKRWRVDKRRVPLKEDE